MIYKNLIGERRLKRQRRTRKLVMTLIGRPISASACPDRIDRTPSERRGRD